MSRIYIFLLIFILLLSTSILFSVKQKVEAVFFDVGQGDSYAFRTNDDRIILIDGGPDWTSLYGLGNWMSYFNRKIDIIILTHAHSDHLAALPEIIKRYQVNKVVLPHHFTGAAARAFLESLSDNTEVIYPEEEFCFDFNTDCFLCIIPPSERFNNSDDENDLSLATYFNCSGLSVLGAGDAPGPREKEIMSSKLVSSVDVLKVSHHGSKDSSPDSWLNYLSPQLVIISVGNNNSYGHPHQELINRLKQRDVNIWRTDLNGSLSIFANHGEIFIKKISWQSDK